MSSRHLQPIRHLTKTQALSAQLSDLAHELGPGARLPTARELCSSLQVSMVTLNRALIELEGRSVLSCRRGVGIFVSQHLGLKNLGLLFDRDIFGAGLSPFPGLLMDAINAQAMARDSEVSVHFALPSRRGYLPLQGDLAAAIRESRMRGVLFSGDQNPEALRWIEEQGVPLVALSHLPISRYRVSVDYESLVRAGVEALQARGCRRIGLWLGAWFSLKRSNSGQVPEVEAFRAALEQHSLPFDPELVWGLEKMPVREPLTGQAQQERGSRAANECFGPDAHPAFRDLDGLIITNDIMTRAALPVMRRLGVQPNRTLQIVSHANRNGNVLLDERANLTLIEVDPAEVARAMLDLLDPLMDGAAPGQSFVLVQPKLAV